MRTKWIVILFTFLTLLQLPLASFSRTHHRSGGSMPGEISAPGEKVIIIDPNIHAFGAYDASGHLLRTGLVTAGNSYCRDIHRGCRTRSGSFRIYSLGGPGCRSHRYPLPHGGAPMPYCMFFNGNQGLHGSYEVVYGNISHGCVRMHVADARWLRYNFVEGPSGSNGYRGTRVIVRPY
jgi:hypothetical protein